MTQKELSATPGIHRVIQGLEEHQQIYIGEQYQRLQPVLSLLLSSRDIYERNRTWPGASPVGKGATSYLVTTNAVIAREVIAIYAQQSQEEEAELWTLFHSFCAHGPIGLLDALDETIRLVRPEIEMYASFLRLGKHPRSDAGLYIREHLNRYAAVLGEQPLPPFLARYLFHSQRKTERWFFPEDVSTINITNNNRRLNTNVDYPHKAWIFWATPLEACVNVNHHCPDKCYPWIYGFIDQYTRTLMGIQVSISKPSAAVFALGIRNAIWHFRQPWWPARGVPDKIYIPSIQGVGEIQSILSRWLHCDISMISSAEPNSYLLLNIDHMSSEIPIPTQSISTISEYASFLHEAYADRALLSLSGNVPLTLQERGVCLPWEDGIAAVLLLPQVASATVLKGIVCVFDIPYETELPEGTLLTLHIDPWDARCIYGIENQAIVHRLSAQTFEHHATWFDIIHNDSLSYLLALVIDGVSHGT